jgi:signal peptidase II
VKSPTRIAMVLFVIVIILALDQATKFYAHEYLIDDPPRSYAGDMFRIQYATNTGAFLGLGNTLPENARFWLFNVFTSVVIAAIFVYVLAAKQMLFFETLAFALLVSGGFGNLIDRMFRDGIVVDFMNMGIGNLRTGIFNIADVAIMAGIFLLLTFKLFEREPKEEKEENAVERAEA